MEVSKILKPKNPSKTQHYLPEKREKFPESFTSMPEDSSARLGKYELVL